MCGEDIEPCTTVNQHTVQLDVGGGGRGERGESSPSQVVGAVRLLLVRAWAISKLFWWLNAQTHHFELTILVWAWAQVLIKQIEDAKSNELD
jgi:hypothetical protein